MPFYHPFPPPLYLLHLLPHHSFLIHSFNKPLSKAWGLNTKTIRSHASKNLTWLYVLGAEWPHSIHPRLQADLETENHSKNLLRAFPNIFGFFVYLLPDLWKQNNSYGSSCNTKQRSKKHLFSMYACIYIHIHAYMLKEHIKAATLTA